MVDDAISAALKYMDLSSFDTAKVTDMRWMFKDCESLTELDVSGFDASNVTDMNEMFSGCTSLTTLACSDSRIRAEYDQR